METQHGDWLRRLAADGKGGVLLPSITRGEAYQTSFTLPLNVTADTFTAALGIAPDAAPLATFTVTKSAFDGEFTTITLALPKATVDGLPADGDANGLTELVYSVQRTPSGGSETRLFAGNVFISGEV
ncbi:hypothetical protein ACIGGE_12055 [Qipengyuania sp. NPDC077410]|uniref:hypothetical protein n=1 Tax=Qipengyuania sp. NPDC077410 TaxID=3364496 RepID=UPI0037CAE42F